jgi:phage terminase large subunit-like protein
MSEQLSSGGTKAITPEQASAEIMRRRKARARLAEYARSIEIPSTPMTPEDPECELFKPIESSLAKHHLLICDKVQQTMETRYGRLMILAPPGSAKSTYVDVVAPCWALSKWPGYRIILTSYETDIARKQSRKARALKKDPRENAIWEPTPDGLRAIIASDQRAAEQWALQTGSEYMAAGILAGITGNRANGVIIDDPLKGRQEADSETIRNRVYEEYQDSIVTRLVPGGWVILINTRWHEDDPSGRILPDDYDGRSGKILCKDGQVWDVLCLAAKCERHDDPLGRKPGEYLWPEWFDLRHWQNFENDPRGTRRWNALFQQRPSAADGMEFKREDIQWYDPDIAPGLPGGRPVRLKIYGGSDYAAKPDRTADFTEHAVAGVDEAWCLWFLDWWSGQVASDKYIAAFIAMVRRWKPIKWWDEGNVIGHAIAPARRQAMRKAKVFVTCEQMSSIHNKALKLSAFQALVGVHTVYFPLNRAWAPRVVDQLCAFPTGRYDDAADVCGLFGRAIDRLQHPQLESQPERKVLKPFTGEWVEFQENENAQIRYN